MNDVNRPEDGEPELPSLEEPKLVIDSVTLARLLNEVRNGTSFAPGAYNRVHNRHNRS